MGLKKKIVIGFLLSVVSLGVLIVFCNKKIEAISQGKLYDKVQTIPYNKVGLLLGTSKYLSGGRINLYYQYRIDAAIELYKAGKIKYIIISGDNGKRDYNEPEMMRDDLIKEGVDSTIFTGIMQDLERSTV